MAGISDLQTRIANMGIYTFKDMKSGLIIEVTRTREDAGVQPTWKEASLAGMQLADYEEAQWGRVFSSAGFHRGDSWSGSKGNW